MCHARQRKALRCWMLRSHRSNLLAIHYSAMICHIGLTMQRLRNSNSTRLHSNHLANAVFGLLALGLVSAPAIAQGDYPVRAITLIVPFAAGGPTDVVARIVGQQMSRTLGQQILIENVVGSAGTTAGIRAMRSPPDGSCETSRICWRCAYCRQIPRSTC